MSSKRTAKQDRLARSGTNSEAGMTDQELLISTLREACLIIANYLEPGARDADEVITQLIAVLDTQELANAIERLDEGRGLRVVK
jgi:hypothetical protein